MKAFSHVLSAEISSFVREYPRLIGTDSLDFDGFCNDFDRSMFIIELFYNRTKQTQEFPSAIDFNVS